MGKFINLLVPDYIFKADDNEGKVVKLFLACVAIYGMMLLFLKLVNVMTGGQDVANWYLWIPIFFFAILGSVIGYGLLLVISYLIVRYPVYWMTKFIMPYCHRLYYLLSKKIRGAKDPVPEVLERSETTKEYDEDQVEDNDEGGQVEEAPSFMSLLKCDSPDRLMSAIKEMTEVNDDKMFFLAILLLLIQHDKLSFRTMNAKEIHCILVQDFGLFLSYSHFQNQWKRLREHNFNPKTIENYKKDRKYFYNDYDRDYDKYCRAGMKLKEFGFI